METISYVRIIDRILGCLVQLLAPITCTEDYNILRMQTDGGKNALMVRLDNSQPSDVQWFIVGLKKHVRVTAIFLCDLIKEVRRLLQVVFGMMVVPVDDDVDASCNARVHNCFDLPHLLGSIVQVTCGVVVRNTDSNA
jgi:hypothetical protein